MPTGYTSELYNGEQSFEDFVLTCARGMGACIMQRDDPLSEKPKLSSESAYHREKLDEATKELARLEKMKPDERKVYGSRIRTKRIKHAKEELAKAEAIRNRYITMKARVESWRAPSKEHEGLKEFMLEQLNSSIDFDGDGSYYLSELKKTEQLTAEDLYQDALKRAKYDINYHKVEMKKEESRNAGRDAWVMQLYASLGLEIPS